MFNYAIYYIQVELGFPKNILKNMIGIVVAMVEIRPLRLKELGKNINWEAEYDATKENAISQSLPCFKLIEIMSLRQQQEDGFYYDSNGMLAAFDTDLTQKVNSVVVRKDILDTFLSKTGMKLVWLVDAEKEIHAGDYSITKWSDWEAVFIYEGDSIAGEIHRLQEKNE